MIDITFWTFNGKNVHFKVIRVQTAQYSVQGLLVVHFLCILTIVHDNISVTCDRPHGLDTGDLVRFSSSVVVAAASKAKEDADILVKEAGDSVPSDGVSVTSDGANVTSDGVSVTSVLSDTSFTVPVSPNIKQGTLGDNQMKTVYLN